MSNIDSEARKRIDQMVNFILQEANEKADEIRQKANEDFQIEKGKILNAEKLRLNQEFERKFKQLDIKRKIEYSTRLNKARLSVLEKREALMKKIETHVRERLVDLKDDKEAYKNLLKGLIIQGLIRIDEQQVEVSCCRDDLELVEAVFEDAVNEFKQIWTREVGTENEMEVVLERKKFVPDASVGGVLVKARRGKIILDNTLSSRCHVAMSSLLNIVRGRLFGVTEKKGMMTDDELAAYEASKHH